MLPHHTEAFFKTADSLHCWIGLREPNALSDTYIGKAGYTAKNEHCKAKSADNPSHPFKGLVVNPEICPEAFLAPSLRVAREKWTGFARKMPPGFSFEESGPLRGLVKFQGKSIHADFDLMYVARADKAGRIAFTTESEQQALMRQVAETINRIIGSTVIQHGAEFGWRGGVGARESENVLSFGPKRAFRQDGSSMPQGAGAMH